MEKRLPFFNKALEIALTVYVFVAVLQNQLITTASVLAFVVCAVLFYYGFQRKNAVYRLVREYGIPLEVALLLIISFLVMASSPTLSVRNFLSLTVMASVLAGLSKLATYLYLKFYDRPTAT